MYHKVSLVSPTMWWVNVNDFYRQMVELSSKKVVYLDDYDPKNESHVVITFDGIYKNVLEYALPILRHFDYPFELFLTSDYLGKDNLFDSFEPNSAFVDEKELTELVNGGGRLQWHTKSHINLKSVLDETIIDEELHIPENIKNLDKNGFNWFAYPYGEYNDVVLNKVTEKFKGAVSCNQGSDEDIYALNRITVINTTKLNQVKVACIIASYNYGMYLVEAIESVLLQTILPDEILITDDCSDDETQIIAESYVKKFPKLIKYNRNSTNLGIVDNFNKAIALTTSDYVFFLGADNRILSNYVEACTTTLSEDESVKIAYTDYAFFGPRAKLTYMKFKEEWKGRIIDETYYQINFPSYDNHETQKSKLALHNFIHGSSMYKRAAFNEVGGYLKSNKEEDYNLFSRIIEAGGMAKKASRTNLEYRQHSLAQANNIVFLQNSLKFYKQQYHELKNGNKNKLLFEKSIIYKYAFFTYRSLKFLKNNYNRPKKIWKHIKKKFKLIN